MMITQQEQAILDAGGQPGTAPIVILGVAASDSHAVANQLIALGLRSEGYQVVNLGTCTSVAEFALACQTHPDAIAVVIGSLNGHVHEDLRDLAGAQKAGLIRCPVIVGGNLSVGSRKDGSAVERLHRLGVQHVLRDPRQLSELLADLAARVRVPVLALAAS